MSFNRFIHFGCYNTWYGKNIYMWFIGIDHHRHTITIQSIDEATGKKIGNDGMFMYQYHF